MLEWRVRGALALLCVCASPLVRAQVIADGYDIDICARTAQVQAEMLSPEQAGRVGSGGNVVFINSHLPTLHCSRYPSVLFLRLKHLNLQSGGQSGNAITSLKERDFYSMRSLRELNLSFNQLAALPPYIFERLFALESLSLAGNQLDDLPVEVFFDLANLEILALQENELRSLTKDVFRGLDGLRDLLLQDNKLENLPVDTFAWITMLERLYLSGNNLNALHEDIFRNLFHLRTLSLADNDLSTLPGNIFSSLGQLNRLDLSQNQLTTLPDFSALGKLRALRLQENDLSTLPAGVFTGLRLDELQLSGNPGAPFPLEIQLKRIDDVDPLAASPATVQAEIVQGTPVLIALALMASAGNLSSAQLVIPAGSTTSNMVIASSATQMVLHILLDEDSLLPDRYDGIDIVFGEPLTLFPIVPTTVADVRVVSAPADMEGYFATETIDVEVWFIKDVLIPAGMPELVLQIGTEQRTAVYAGAYGVGRMLRFHYVVTAVDRDDDGISILADALRIVDINAVDGHGVDLSLAGHELHNDRGHKVDGGRNRAPILHGDVELEFAEGDTHAVSVFVARDPDAMQTVSWSLGGADANSFHIDESDDGFTGALMFTSSPDFETPMDADSDNVYAVIIKVTDNGTPPATTAYESNIRVLDREERGNDAGEVRFSWEGPVLRIEDLLTARLSDADEGVTVESWVWQRSSSCAANGNDWVNIDGVGGASVDKTVQYRPPEAYYNQCIRAAVFYRDEYSGTPPDVVFAISPALQSRVVLNLVGFDLLDGGMVVEDVGPDINAPNSGVFEVEVYTRPRENVLSRDLTLQFRTEAVVGYAFADADDYSISAPLILRRGYLLIGGFAIVAVEFRILPDDKGEPEERFRLVISGSDAQGSPADILGEPPEISIAASDYASVTLTGPHTLEYEGGTAVYTIAVHDVFAPVRIAYRTYDGTDVVTAATAPDDYSAVTGVLTFTPGVTQQTVAVQTTNDFVPEADEMFGFSISIESGFALFIEQHKSELEVITRIPNDDKATGEPPVIYRLLTIDGAHGFGAKPIQGQGEDNPLDPSAIGILVPEDNFTIFEEGFRVARGYVVRDAEAYWLLGGEDADLFELDRHFGSIVQLLFRDLPDFEMPLDDDGDNIYRLTLQATTGLHRTVNLVIRVRDAEEGALHVTIDGESITADNPPTLGVAMAAELRDLGDLSRISGMISWTWSVTDLAAPDQPVVLFRDTSAPRAVARSSYAPTAAAAGADKRLRLRVEYQSERGPQFLLWISGFALRASLPRPVFAATSLSGAAELTWSLPGADDLQFSRWDYRVREGTDAAYGGWLPVPLSRPGSANADGITMHGLRNGVRYYFQVRAANSAVAGDPSAEMEVVPVGVPRGPVLATTAGDEQVLLAWSLTGDGQNGGVLTGWEYELDGTAWTPVPDSGPGDVNAVGYAVKALTNGRGHRFRVRALNSAGAGLASAGVIAHPVQNAPVFAGQAAGLVEWYVDTPVRLVLPEATGGDIPLRYTLGGVLPAGVSLRNRELSGIPAAVMEAMAHDWQVQDADGDTATWPLSLAVLTAPAVGSLLYMEETTVAVGEGEQVDVGLRVNPALAEALNISWRLVAGQAGLNDYRDVSGGTLTMSPNQDRARIRVEAVNDLLSEGIESFAVELQAATGVTLGTSTTVVNIAASDPLTMVLTGPDTVDEGAVAEYTVRLSGGTSTEAVRVMPGLGAMVTVPQDVLSLPELLTLSPGVAVATFSLTTVADNVVEDDKQLVVMLSGVEGGGGMISLHAVEHTVSTAVVDRSAPVISGPKAPDFVTGQPGSVASYRATDANGDVVRWSLAGDDAGHFYILSIGGVLSFRTAPDYASPDDANMDRIYELQVIAEDDGEPPARAMLPVRVRLLAADVPTVTAAFGASSLTAMEGGSTATMMVELSTVPNRAVAIPVLLESTEAEAADWRVSGLSGTPGNYALDFAATETQQGFTVTAVNDNIVEGSERLSLRFARLPAGVNPGSVVAAELNLLDDDVADIRIVESFVGVDEPGQADFTVEISAEIAAMLTVDWSAEDGTAMAPGDYPASSRGSIVFPANSVANTRRGFSVSINDDRFAETAEEFRVHLGAVSSPLAAARLAVVRTPATVRIASNDPITVELSGAGNVVEGAEAVYTVALSGGQLMADVTVDWSTAAARSGDIATAGVDYSMARGTLTFMAANPADQMIRVPTLEDPLYDPRESFRVVLSNPQSGGGDPATLGTAMVVTTIDDNDMQDRVTVGWESAAYTVSESASGVPLCAALSEGALSGARTLELAYGTQDGTAEAGTDYTATSRTLTFSKGDTRVCATVSLPEDNDTVNGDRTFSVELTSATGMPGMDVAATLVVATATVTIEDNDRAMVSLSGPSDELDEGDVAEFMVSLSAPVATALMVAWSAENGTAIAPGDYMAEGAGSVMFPANVTIAQRFTVSVADDNLSELAEEFTVSLGTATSSLSERVTVGMDALTVTIAANDPIMVALSGAGAVVEGAEAVYTVALSGGVHSTTVRVRYDTAVVSSGIAATAGTDYAAAGGILTFTPRNNAEQMIEVETLDDTLYDPGESFQVVLSNPQGGGGTPPALGTTTVVTTITDNDMQDQVTAGWASPTYTVTETETRVEVCAQLSTGELSGTRAVRLNYATRNGTAVAGRDYTSSTGTLRLSKADTRACAIVSLPADNGTVNGDRTFDVVLAGVQGIPDSDVAATLGAATTTVTIADNDSATVSLSRHGPLVDLAEGDVAEFMVSLSAPVAAALVVSWSAEDGTAVAPGDYVAGGAGSVMFPANMMTAQSFTVSVVDDNLSELAEAFTVRLGAAAGSLSGEVTVETTLLTVTIVENDPIMVELSGAGNVMEGAEAVYTVALSGGEPTAAVTVDWSTEDAVLGTAATVDVDYSVGGGPLTFTVANFAEQEIRVPTLDDTLYDPGESFRVVLRNPQGGGGTPAMLGTATAVTTITDDDMQDQVTVGWESAAYTVSEAKSGVQLCAALSEGSTLSGDRTLALAYETQDVTAEAGTDYAAASGTLTLREGDAPACVEVMLLAEDTVINSARIFRVVLTRATGMPITDVVAMLGTAIATVTIADDESATVRLSVSSDVLAEGAAAEFTVHLSTSVAAELVVSWSTADGTAMAPGDYVAEPAGRVVFAANMTTAQSFTVRVEEDDLSELVEDFTVRLGAATGSLAGEVMVETTPLTVTIAENDPIMVALSGVSAVVEGAEVVYTVALSGGVPTADVTVEYATIDAISGTTATAGDDYTVAGGSLTFVHPDRAPRMFSVRTVDDTLYDPDESFQVVLSNLQGGGLLELGTAMVVTTITDNDTQDRVTAGWESAAYTVSESESRVQLCAALSGGNTLSGDRTLVLAYETRDGTAVSGTDYTADTGTLMLREGDTQACVEVMLLAEDTIINRARTFSMVLIRATGMPITDVVSMLGTEIATVTIADNDTAMVSLSGPSGALAEGGVAEFMVSLSAPVAEELVVAWSVMDGTAVAPGDYVAEGSGSVMFAANAMTAQSFTVRVADDNLSELAEDFTVSLGAATGSLVGRVTVDPALLTVTIMENDPITVELSGANSVAEGDSVVYTVALSGGEPTAAVTVNWSTADAVSGTAATAGVDYASVMGSLSFTELDFAPRSFSVQTTVDVLYDPAESFQVVLRNPQGGGGAPARLGTALVVTTIGDNDMQDQVTAGWEQAAYMVSESESRVQLCAVLSVGTLSGDRTLELAYETQDGTVEAGTDYTEARRTLTLQEGDTRACAEVTLLAEDTIINRARTFRVVLTRATGMPGMDVDARLSAITLAVVTIADDDNLMEFTGDTSVDVADASVFYHALALSGTLVRGGRNVQAALERYISDDSIHDPIWTAQDALDKVEALVRVEALVVGGPSRLASVESLVADVTDDDNVDLHDAVVFYYALSLPGALGNGDSGGNAVLRQQILGPFLEDRYDTPVPDSVLQTMLRRANALRK